MKKVFLLFALIVALASCEKLNSHGPSDGIISGYAQKGYLVEGSKVTAIAFGKNMIPTGDIITASITGSLGAFSINVEGAKAYYYELKAEGYYFDEVTGEITESPICLEAFVKSSDSKANLNLFTTITKERIKKLISSRKSYDKAKTQAQVEFYQTVNLVGADIDFTKLDITGGSDADAMLLLTTCAIQSGREASELTVILQQVASEFRESGTISEKSANELFRPGQELDIEIVFDNLKKYYNEHGLSTDDLPSYWKYFYLEEGHTMSIISNEGLGMLYTELKTPEAASGTYKIVSIEPFTVSTDVDWITFEKKELEKEVFELKVNIAENKTYERREGHLFLSDANSNVLRTLQYVQGPVINPKASLIGEGTTENPFLIECLDDLIYMRDVYNKTSDRLITSRNDGSEVYASGAVFQLTSDIDLSPVCGPDKGDWTPIGIFQGDIHNNRSGFDGTFICSKTDSNGALLTDSPGYTISGLYINNDKDYQGLFGVFKGTVCDLNINGEVSGGDYVGLLAGYACTDHIINIETRGKVKVSGRDTAGGIAGGFEGTIIDCTNYAEVTSINSNFNSIGGITGRSTGTVNHCINHGSIGGSYCLGGIVGKGSNTYIFDCTNYGKVSGEGPGGIVGTIEGVIDNCANYADITSEGLCGGIAAHSSDGTINHSRNYGSIRGRGSAGGIVDMCTSDIYDCSNYGNVSAGSCVGGIVGDTHGNIVKSMEIVNCCNNGDLNLTFDVNAIYYSAGGIVGTIGYDENNFYSIVNCYSTGTFPLQGNSVNKSFGGICGELIRSSNIKVAQVYYMQKEMPAIGNVGIRIGDDINGDYSNIIENCFILTPEQMKGLEPYDGVLYKSKDGKSFNTLLESLNAFLEDNKNNLPEMHFWEYSSEEPYPVLSEPI